MERISSEKIRVRDVKRVAVVGGGLAGSLAAIKLAQRGWSVDVFERRGDSRRAQNFAGKSINLALSHRGRVALRSAGVEDDVISRGIRMYRRMMHFVDGSLSEQPYGINDQHIMSVGRQMLAETLVSRAEQLDSVRFYFSANCLSVDLARSIVTVEFSPANDDDDDENGDDEVAERKIESRQYDLIVGSDGAYSRVRGAMARVRGFNFSQQYVAHGYKELSIAPTPSGEFALGEHECLHIWPRGNFMLIGLPNPNRTFTMTLFMPLRRDEGGDDSFEALQSDDAVREFFERLFPDAMALMPDLVEQWHANPVSHLVMMRCASWAVNRSVLIGDAAHALVPFYGQGMNASLEDVDVLMHRLDSAEFVDDALLAFSRERKPDGDAIQDLSWRNYFEMRDHVASSAWLMRKSLERTVHRLAPERFIPLYSMVSFTSIPYAQVIERDKRQQATLSKLIAALALAAPIALGALWWRRSLASSSSAASIALEESAQIVSRL
jgi:kynurenine 3-monooxygenase